MGQKKTNQARKNEKSKTRPGQVNWRSVDPYLRFFKATDLGSISSLNTLTTWFDETNHYFGLVRGIKVFIIDG